VAVAQDEPCIPDDERAPFAVCGDVADTTEMLDLFKPVNMTLEDSEDGERKKRRSASASSGVRESVKG